ELRRDSTALGLCRTERDSTPKPRQEMQRMIATVGEGRLSEGEWKQEIVMFVFNEGEREVSREHGHNSISNLINPDRLAEDVPPGAKTLLPEVKADYGVTTGRVIVRN